MLLVVLEKWVPELRHYAPAAPIVLVGTKLDLRDDRQFHLDYPGACTISTEQVPHHSLHVCDVISCFATYSRICPSCHWIRPCFSKVSVACIGQGEEKKITSSAVFLDWKSYFLLVAGLELKKQIGALAYIECSSKTQQNVKAVFDAAIKVVLQPAKQKKQKKRSSICRVL
ncbi:hypothetical protein V6N12_009710 [Hibiscus sabdariffa]|uniref:Uncharacterized protein n=1 Tax=Hibiscus sabdariffa TaxID=183260 RepID=A0ABR2AI48_9ROSI